jgi:GAF domain-containing protein
MSALSLLSIALLVAAMTGCAVLWSRSGETRVGLFGALFLLTAIHLAIAPWTDWNAPLGWNISSLGGLVGLAVGALGVLVVVAIWRTLGERDRIEKLHWDSMETVRIINELAESGSISLDAKLARLLEMGASRFDLEVAMVTRVRKDRYEIIAIHSPESFPVKAGAVFSLEETFCKHILDSERPVGIEQISESNWAESLDRAAFPFNAYLGAAITFDGVSYGTLNFASFEPRKDRFTGTEKDLIRLMAQWIGSEIGKHSEREASVDSSTDSAVDSAADSSVASSAAPSVDSFVEPSAHPSAKEPTLAAFVPSSSTAQKQGVDERRAARSKAATSRTRRRPDPQTIERVIDPNRILQRLGNELRALAGDAIDVEMKLAPNLGFAAAQNLPLKTIARTLVMNARDAMPEGGKLVVESANLEIAAGEPGQIPARAPDRYVTLSFTDSGKEPDADALARLFDRAPADAERTNENEKLALSTVYRVLQVCGGDLSVKIEPGCGSTFTVYLPRARERVRTPRTTAPALAPAMPSSIAD